MYAACALLVAGVLVVSAAGQDPTTTQSNVCGEGTIWSPEQQQCVVDDNSGDDEVNQPVAPQIVKDQENLALHAPEGDITLHAGKDSVSVQDLAMWIGEVTRLRDHVIADLQSEMQSLRSFRNNVLSADCNGAKLIGFSPDGVPQCDADKMVSGSCEVGETVTAIQADGSVVCKDATSLLDKTRVQLRKTDMSCSDGNYLAGFDEDGNVDCRKDTEHTSDVAAIKAFQQKLSQTNCGAGKMVAVDANGEGQCATDKGVVGACDGGESVVEIRADGTVVCKDTTALLDKNRVQVRKAGDTISCGTGQYLANIDVDGNVVCRTDVKPTGSCSSSPDSFVDGVDQNGKLTCKSINANRWQRRLSTGCSAGSFIASVDAGGQVSCKAGVSKTCPSGQVIGAISSTSATCIADQKGSTAPPGSGTCYVRWGFWGCASGYTEVVHGNPGGFESYQNSGALSSNVECVLQSARVFATWGSPYHNRLMRAQSDMNGMDMAPARCSVCCTGGCFTLYGGTSCPTGYARKYSGYVGGVEGYDGADVFGKTLCVDSTARYRTWSSGYSSRLMRHRDTSASPNGMQSVTNSCAVCCKN